MKGDQYVALPRSKEESRISTGRFAGLDMPLRRRLLEDLHFFHDTCSS